MMKYLLSLSLLVSLSFITQAQVEGCDGTRYREAIFTPEEIGSTLDVKYGENISIGGNTIELFADIFYPEVDDVEERPFMLLIHGGSFIGGERQDMHSFCVAYAQRGYVTASINYRLYDGPPFPLPDSTDMVQVVLHSVEDATAALRFMKNDAEQDNTYGINPDYMLIGGISAGAITSVQTAYFDDEDEIPAFMAPYIDPELGLGGASNDLVDVDFEVVGVLNFSGAIYDEAWMDADDEPIYSVHDDGDMIVPYGVGYATVFSLPIVTLKGSQIVNERADELGITNTLITIENSNGHVSYFGDPVMTQMLLDETSNFAANIVCTPVSSVEEKEFNTAVSAQPNPSTDLMQFDLGDYKGRYTLEVRNQMGQLVWNQSSDATNFSLSKDDLGTGMFIIQLQFEDSQYLAAPQKVIFH